MKKLIFALGTAVCLLCSTLAHAGVYKLDFTASGFRESNGNLPPQDPVSGSILFTAESLNSQITAINAVDLTINGYTFTVEQVGGVNYTDDNFLLFGGKVSSVTGVSNLTNDFWVRLRNGVFLDFIYARENLSGIWSTETGTVSIAEQGAQVPEPASLALLLAGLGGIGALRRRRQ